MILSAEYEIRETVSATDLKFAITYNTLTRMGTFTA